MPEKVDRRIRKTKSQLRAGLARLMQKKSINEITVKELVEEVDINRSTFYLHYTDIYQMLDSIEQELTEEFTAAIASFPINPLQEDSFPLIAQLFTIIEENQDICRALLGTNGDMAFVTRIEEIIAERVLKQLASVFQKNIRDIAYAYAFCLNGCVGLIKTWLVDNLNDTPQHMAELTNILVVNTVHNFISQNS
ncbi:MAG: TetR-like C-terminal domain-containing protein [Lachnospiraceae bacterium]|nr:TetR-like C-terminal domain-containing protein [Lachnospiraceae bacterium]